jgi:1-phosphatidylinositol-4-phosphate 5-kinase
MWKNDKFCGWGRESRCNGDTFEGRFENGLINGKGIFVNKKNCKYIGDFKNMKRWGKGKLQTNKIIYEGDFYNNMIHGIGRIKFLKNKVEYIGNFKNNKIDGKGVIKFQNGDKYEVEIKNGLIIKIENDIFENSNGGDDILLSDKKDIKNNKNITIINGGYNNNNNNLYINNVQINGQNNYINLNANDINNIFLNNNINNDQIQDQDNTPDCLLSTYRNYGFNDTNNTFT